MKVWLIKHKDYALRPENLRAWARAYHIPPDGVRVESVHAFLRKRDAEAWLASQDEYVRQHSVVVGFVG